VPTAAGSAYRELRPEVDELVALMRPEPFYGVGTSYEDFSQISSGTGAIRRTFGPQAAGDDPVGHIASVLTPEFLDIPM
jgi:hypothetical protein